MATKKTEAAASNTTEALERRAPANEAMAVAGGYDRNDQRGKEGIESSDMRLPFMAIAQKTSKAIDPSEVGKFIEGLKFLDTYNSETREVYGQGPIQFIPVVLRKRAHLLKENGTLGEPVAWNDARVTWEGARAAGKEKPEGQQIYDWAVLLVPSMELLVLSLRSTSFGAGQTLNRLVNSRSGPAFAGKYSLTVVPDKNAKGSFGKFAVVPAGKPTTDEVAFAEDVYENMKGKTITIADEPDPADAAGDAVDGEVVPASGGTGEKAPF